MKTNKAFTLVELLVVISIIALLLAILLPSLGAVKYQAKTVVCQTRVNQFLKAALSWAVQDSRGRLPVGGRHGAWGDVDTGYGIDIEGFFKFGAMMSAGVPGGYEPYETAKLGEFNKHLDTTTATERAKTMDYANAMKVFRCPFMDNMKIEISNDIRDTEPTERPLPHITRWTSGACYVWLGYFYMGGFHDELWESPHSLAVKPRYPDTLADPGSDVLIGERNR